MPPRQRKPAVHKKPLDQMTDEELQAIGRIRVPVLGGLWGYKIMTLKEFNKRQNARNRATERQRRRRRSKIKKTARQVITGKPKRRTKKRRWIIPGIIYWE